MLEFTMEYTCIVILPCAPEPNKGTGSISGTLYVCMQIPWGSSGGLIVIVLGMGCIGALYGLWPGALTGKLIIIDIIIEWSL